MYRVNGKQLSMDSLQHGHIYEAFKCLEIERGCMHFITPWTIEYIQELYQCLCVQYTCVFFPVSPVSSLVHSLTVRL